MPAPDLTVIGLDAATFTVIDPLLENGDMPNLARLFAGGSRGVLRSTTHPLTPQAWSTMLTGVNAGRHGVWDFAERDEDGYRMRLVNGSFRRAPAVWDHLSASGRRMGFVNVPFTWPAPELNGFSISGFDAAGREGGMTYPAEVIGELRSRFGPLALDHRFPIDAEGNVDLDSVRRAVEQKLEIAMWLAERYDPELLFVVFMAADHIQHMCFADWFEQGLDSPVAGVYRILDEAVGALVEHAQGRDVMVVSDHGGGRLEGVVNLNHWLSENGYLEYAGAASMIRKGDLQRRVFRNAFRLRKRLPHGIRNAIKQRAPRLRDRTYDMANFSIVDWSATRAFAYGTYGNIVINMRGRERDGIVEPGAEYERVRDELVEKLQDLRGPDGRPIVAAVHRREELFHGPMLGKLPDLVVEFDQYRFMGKGNLTDRTPELWDKISIKPANTVAYTGSHRHEGIVALSGPSAVAGGELFAEIQDVAPTILYLLGEPIPADLEGRLLAEAIDPQLLDERAPEYGDAVGDRQLAAATAYDADEANEVSERLRGLGYLE